MQLGDVSPRARQRIAALAVTVVVLSGCGTGSAPPSPPSQVSLLNCGTPMTVAKPPTRAVTINQPATDLMFALGLGDRIVAKAGPLEFPALPEYASAETKLAVLPAADSYPYPRLQTVLDQHPDFLFAHFESLIDDSGGNPWQDRAAFKAGGIDVYVPITGCRQGLRKATLDGLFTEERDIAAIFGVPDRATALIDDQKARVTAAKGLVTKPNYRVWWWDGPLAMPSSGCCGVGDLIMSAVGVSNALGDGSVGRDWEDVAKRDVDVIVIVDGKYSPADTKKAFLQSDPRFKNLPAVVNQRFIVLPEANTSLPGIRNVLGIESFAKGLAGLPAAST